MEDTPKHRSHKKLFRSRSLRSVGQFMQRLLRTLSHLGEGDRGTPEPEDDEGGFRHKDHPGVPQEETGRVQGGDSNNNRCQELPPGKTEMGVPPGKAEVPGVLGLKNHGNTCFMNAVIQCLSNTDLLAEYLGTERYRAHGEEVSAPGTRGEVSAPGTRGEVSAPGTRGEVTERLASLVRALWTRQYTPQISAEFKSAVARHGSQFRGNSQHDALEFLMWLLDRVHEDLNSSPAGAATKRPACERSGPDSSPGDGGHSFVQEHFQAQYRSSLTCPHCHKQSDTFDPFLCVSLPIPLRQTRALNVTLVFQSQQHRFLRVGLAVPLLGSVAALRQMAADQGNIPPDQVILAELYPSGFQRSFSDDEDVNSIAEGDPVYAFHVPLPRTPSSGFPRSLPSSPRSSHTNSSRLPGGGSASSEVLASKLLLLLCNVDGAGQQALRFGPPLVLREDRTVSWDQLQQNILAKTRYLMQSDAHLPSIGADVIFHVRVAGAPASSCYLSETDARPLQHPAVDRALQLCGSGGPPHVKLAVEWDSKTKERLFGSIQEEVVRDDESVRAQQLDHQQQSCTLDECFQLYTKEEQLAPDDAWRCPHCKVLQQGTVKLSLWTLPDILIIHLKRFRQVGGRRNKLSTLVKFPLTRMDMAPHVVKRGHGSRGPAGQWSTWRTAQCQMDGGQMDVMYDLYAVCNHHGSLQGGHYTAYCRNSMDARWYGYDDSNVEVVQEEEEEDDDKEEEDGGDEQGDDDEEDDESSTIGCVKVIEDVDMNFNPTSSQSSEQSSKRPLLGLVVTPTRELAVQVKHHIDAVAKFTGIRTAIVVGGMAPQKQQRLLNRRPEIVIATPGRLWEMISEEHPHLCNLKQLKCLVIDEADRMVEKGHYAELSQLLEMLRETCYNPKRQTFVFSATLTLIHQAPSRLMQKKNFKKMDKETKLESLMEKVGMKGKPKVIDLTRKQATVETLTETRIHCSADEKDFYLYYFLLQYPGRTMVFANSIDCIKRLTSLLTILECNPLPLHANMHQKQRLKNLERFAERDRCVLLTTDVAARGLDIPNIQHVLHYQVPRTSETYVHRSGRTARASSDGLTLLLVGPDDMVNFRKIFRTLEKSEELPFFPVESKCMKGIKERVDLARQIEKMEYFNSKRNQQNSWIQQAADALELDIDDDVLIGGKQDEQEDRAKQKALKFMKKQLKRLLSQPIFRSVVKTKYPTKSGKLVLPDLPAARAESALHTLSTHSAKKSKKKPGP